MVDYQPIKTNHQRLFVEYDPERGWHNIPNAVGDYVSSEYRIHLVYNAHGIRGPERSYEKPADVYRIVILGDSFIDGYSVAQEHRVTEQLEQLLNAAQTTKRVEVIALGTAGYSTDQELIWLQTEGMRYHPDLVILMFYFNDVLYNAQGKYWRGAKPLFVQEGETLKLTNVPVPDLVSHRKTPSSSLIAKMKDWCREHVKLYALVRYVLTQTSLAPEAKKSNGNGAGVPRELAVYKKEVSSDLVHAWRMTELLIREMYNTATANGVRFLAFHIPILYSIYPHEWEAFTARYHLAANDWDLNLVPQRFLAICQETVPCLDPTARFLDAARAQAAENQRLYYHYDLHWNANGHALAAHILAEYVLTHGLVSEGQAR
jgi:hypothetical protein